MTDSKNEASDDLKWLLSEWETLPKEAFLTAAILVGKRHGLLEEFAKLLNHLMFNDDFQEKYLQFQEEFNKVDFDYKAYFDWFESDEV